MKSILKTVAGIMVLSAGSIGVEAADYADLSNDELVQQRSQVRELAPEDRASYRTEMQSRMQSMSSDERALFRDLNNMGGQGNGSGQMNRYGQGSGDGSGKKHRYGQGGGQGGGNGSGNMYRYGQGGGQGGGSGSGNMYRYGQSDSQGYGSGYGSRQGGGHGGGGGGGRRNR